MNIHKKDIKEIVKEKYSQIAQQSKNENETSCCGSVGCCGVDYTIFSENYEKLEGYNPDADLGLGCGIPTQFAQIKKGDTILDLGSGAVMYAGCVAGAIQKEEYIEIIKHSGFRNIEINKEKEIELPDEILRNYLTDTEHDEFKNNRIGIFSITVTASK